MIFRVALRQEQAAVVGSGECAAIAAREETPPVDGELPSALGMTDDGCGMGTHHPGVSKPR